MVRGILFHRVTPVSANGCHQGGVAHVWVITLVRQERRAPGVLVSAFSDQVQPPQGSPRHERCTPRPVMSGQSTSGYRSSGSLHPCSCSTGTQSVCIEPSEHIFKTDTAELVVAIAASSRVDGYTCGKSMTHGE